MAQLEDLEHGNYHFSFKLVVVGDVGVGKSTLLTHHVQDDEVVDMSAEVERGYCADFLIKSYEKDGNYQKDDGVVWVVCRHDRTAGRVRGLRRQTQGEAPV